ncbi:MAG: ABC transporter ATP-binding protein, partial [Solirubrobacteraceae bacterium]
GPPASLGAAPNRSLISYRTADGPRTHETDDPTALLHELTSAALARGGRVEDLRVTRPSLEDVYLELTGA